MWTEHAGKQLDCNVELATQVVIFVLSVVCHHAAKRMQAKNHAAVKPGVGAGAEKAVTGGSALSVKRAILSGQFGFMVPVREESAFMDGTYNPATPIGPLRDLPHSALQQLVYILKGDMGFILWQAINLALFVGIGATLNAMWSTSTEQWARDVWLSVMPPMNRADLLSEYKYLPTFLIGFMVSAEAARWLQSFNQALSVQGRIHDLALFLAGGFFVNGAETRATRFKFFRYLNAVHYLLYFNMDARISKDPDLVCKALEESKLLTQIEAVQLRATHPKMRDAMLGWISKLFMDQVHGGSIDGLIAHRFLGELSRLRGTMAGMFDMLDTYPSNAHTTMLAVTTKILIMFYVLNFTVLNLYEGNPDDMKCIHGVSMFASVCIIFGYMGMMGISQILSKSPFDAHGDPVNIDRLLCSSEAATFCLLRSSITDFYEQESTSAPVTTTA